VDFALPLFAGAAHGVKAVQTGACSLRASRRRSCSVPGLGPLVVAWGSLPGAIALAAVPPHMHRLTVRIGHTPCLVAAAKAGATFAGGLALARDSVTIAVPRILPAVALAAILPIEQAAFTEAAGPARIGRPLGL
jgi:hypothetical protein